MTLSKIFIFTFFIISLSFFCIKPTEINRNTENIFRKLNSHKIKCKPGEISSSKGCVDKCPKEEEYVDEILGICVKENNCNNLTPFADSTTKKCVTAFNCDVSNPFGDKISKKCVLALDCDWTTPFGDTFTKTCVRVKNCNTLTPYGDISTKMCVTESDCVSRNLIPDEITKLCFGNFKNKYEISKIKSNNPNKLFSSLKHEKEIEKNNFSMMEDTYSHYLQILSDTMENDLKNFVNRYFQFDSERYLFSLLEGSEEIPSVKNLITIQNSVKKLLDAILKISDLKILKYINYGSFQIKISNSTNSSIDFITNQSQDDLLPYCDFTSCLTELNKNFNDNEKTFLIGQIIWSSSLISALTSKISNSTGIYSVVYDTVTKSKLDCSNLNIFVPDPLFQNIRPLNISLLYSVNTNPYDNTGQIYNDRCYQFMNKDEGYDITLQMRRKFYKSDVTLNCLNFNSLNKNVNDCKFVGVTSLGYVNCSCGRDYSDIFIGTRPNEANFNKDVSHINLDLVTCYHLNSYYGQPYKNAGVYFGIISFCASFFISILVKFMYDSDILMERHLEDIINNDTVINNKIELNLFNATENEQEKEKLKEKEKVKENEVIIINENKNNSGKNMQNNNFIENKEMNDFDDGIKKPQVITVIEQKTQLEDQKEERSFTIREYFNMTRDEKLKFDKRTFKNYFMDQLMNTHVLLIFFFKKSIFITPVFRWFMLCDYINLTFLLNAMLYTEDYIEKRSENSKVNYWVYVWSYEILKSVYVSIIIIAPMIMLNLIVSSYGTYLRLNINPNTNPIADDKNREKIKNCLKTEKKIHLDSPCQTFRKFIFILISISIILFTFYYLILFSGLYHFSQLGWLYGGFVSLILDMFGIMILWPLCGSILRSLALKFKWLNWMIHFSKIDYLNFYTHN